MGPSWRDFAAKRRQDGPRGSQDSHLEALWGAILGIFRRLGSDLCRNAPSIKSNNPTTFLVDFGVQGGPVGGSWRPSWPILASSWAMLADVGVKLRVNWPSLGDLGVKLGPSWQDIGTKMPKKSQDSQLKSKKPMGYGRPGGRRSHLSARGGLLWTLSRRI